MPEVIVGHGVLGRLLARLVILAGEKPPIVWEKNIFRHAGATDYDVVLPEFDSRSDYDCIYDVSGDSDILDSLIGKVKKGGEVVMAGFYPERVSFGFAQAFIKEVSVRVSAEFTPEDVATTKLLIEDGSLSFDGLVSDVFQINKANEAYKVAFEKAECLKMVLDWRNAA
jgi:3-hydroxyethyl bacteriochlorophyllide a dehydrogenase